MTARVAAVTIAIALALVPARIEASFVPPPLVGHIVDTTGTVADHDRSLVDARLERLRKHAGYAIVVFVTRSLERESIEDVAYATFNTWKIGDVGKDNGILVVIAPTERKIRIETGKGAGGAVTDLQTNDIIAKMAGAMRRNQIAAAIDIACTELEQLIVKDAKPVATAPKPEESSAGLIVVIVMGLVAGAIGLACVASRRFREGVWPVLRAIGYVVWGIAKIASLFTGRGSSSGSRYKGGGGRSGGGGSSGGY